MIGEVEGGLVFDWEPSVSTGAELLAGRDRTLAGPTAPADGLVFLGPLYPPEWELPAEVTLPA